MTALRERLRGMTPPLVTPLVAGELDHDGLAAVIQHVLDGGVDALFVAGTTGEAASLTREEQRRLIDTAGELAPSETPVLVGGTGTAIADTREWIRTAADAGADGVFLTAPYFHTSEAADGYRRFFEEVIADTPVPIVLYNIPGFVGRELPQDVVVDLADHDAVIGLKDSSGDLGYGMDLVDRTPEEFLVLQGFDVLLLPSLRMGFDGGVNAGANAFPEAYAAVVAEPEADRAQRVHDERIRPLFEFCAEHGFAPGIKATLAAAGIIDSNDVRPPHVPLAPGEVPASLVNGY